MNQKLRILSAVLLSAAAALTVFSCAATKAIAADTGAEELLEGFNGSTAWKAVGKNWGDGDCSTSALVTDEWHTEGTGALKGSFAKTGETGGAATYFTEAPAVADFSPYESVLFDVYNPLEVPVQVSFAVTTGGGWEWYESNVFEVAHGEARNLQADFYTGTLKCALTGWQFTANLGDSDDVRRVAVKFQLPADTEGFLYIDNIRLK